MANSQKPDQKSKADGGTPDSPQDSETKPIEEAPETEVSMSDKPTEEDVSAGSETDASADVEDAQDVEGEVDAKDVDTEPEQQPEDVPDAPAVAGDEAAQDEVVAEQHDETPADGDAASDTEGQSDAIDVDPDRSQQVEEAGEESSEKADALSDEDEASVTDPTDAESLDSDTAEADTTETTEDAEQPLDEKSENAPEVEGVKEPEPAERVAEPEPKIIRETQVVKGSIWPGVFGGVIAALVGFIVGRGELLDNVLPASMQRPAVDTSAIEAATQQVATLSTQNEAQKTALAAQSARIDALENAPAPEPAPAPAEGADPAALTALTSTVSALTDRVAALEARPVPEAGPSEDIQAAQDSVSALTDRVAALEARPIPETGPSEDVQAALDSVSSLQTTLTQQGAQLAELTKAAQTAKADAESEAARLLARAALARVEVAVDSGEPFDTALTDLEDVTPVDVPDPLRAAAEAGVPTLVDLQASFPAAARAGLAAARAEVPETEVNGVAGFLRRQLNVRSVAPREGSDPDAILSRAEAAVRNGNLDAALTEMEALPDATRNAMNDWLEAASARKSARDAARSMADSLSGN